MITDCFQRTVSCSSFTGCIVLEGSSICWQKTALKIWYSKQWAQNLRVTEDRFLDNGVAPALCHQDVYHLQLLWPGGRACGEHRLSFATAVKQCANIKTSPCGIRISVLLKALMFFCTCRVLQLPRAISAPCTEASAFFHWSHFSVRLWCLTDNHPKSYPCWRITYKILMSVTLAAHDSSSLMENDRSSPTANPRCINNDFSNTIF